MNAKKKKMMLIGGVLFLTLVSLISYRIYANVSSNKEKAARASQGRAVAVEVASVSRSDMAPTMTFSANLEPLWSADISAKVDGRIDCLNADEGDIVAGGRIIAVLDTNELAAQVAQAEGNLLSSQASLEQAQLDLNRTQALIDQGAISIQALDNARTKRDLTVGQVRSAQGNLSLLQARLDNANIIVPRYGIVLKRYIQAGTYTKAGAPIVNIGDISALLAKVTVSEGQIGQIALGSMVKIKVNAADNREFVGTVTRISPAAVLPSRTFTVEVTIPNGDNFLKPGMFAKANIPIQVHKNVIAVPEAALVSREDQKTIFVVKDNNKVEQRVLKLGYVGDGLAEVLEGLTDGERIVVAGHNKLKDGSPILDSVNKEGVN